MGDRLTDIAKRSEGQKDWRHKVAPWYDKYKAPTREQAKFQPNQAWNQQAANEARGPNPSGDPLPRNAAGWDQAGRPKKSQPRSKSLCRICGLG
jgi:hypothetical protein